MSEYQCPECNRWYKTEFRRDQHKIRKHDKAKVYGDECTCCHCGEQHETTSALAQHIRNEHGEEYHKLNDGRCYIKRYRKVKREIPEKYHEGYEDMTGSGISPLSVQAAVCYIESEIDQKTASNIFAVTDATLRKRVESLIDMGAVSLEYVQDNCKREGDGQFGERTAGERKWKPEQ